MKKNLPITDTEITFDSELISTTDLKGIIKEFNEAFLKVSGFESEELENKNHNVIRHPDMPPEAFKDLWDHVKRRQHWMGMVKNRTKQGDYYWVDAYVTPIFEGDKVVGYESVRVKPDPELVKRAEKIYQQINSGKKPNLLPIWQRLNLKPRSLIQNIAGLVSGLVTFAICEPYGRALAVSLSLAVGITVLMLLRPWVFSSLNRALKLAKSKMDNPLMALIYTGTSDEIGQILLIDKLMEAKIRTMLGRLKDSGSKIEQESFNSIRSQSHILSSIKSQAGETNQVATAMTEMAASIQEVSQNANHAASSSAETDEVAKQGAANASSAIEGIEQLDNAYLKISNVVANLHNDSQAINSIIEVINQIAEQTNLLALNAAIEAARAGEHGRGFSVVADEVRKLAARTQESTLKISQLITDLGHAMTEAVSTVSAAKTVSSDSRSKVENVIASLKTIADKVRQLNDLNLLIATAVEEQSAVSEDINKNIVHISREGDGVISSAEELEINAENLSRESKKLFNMINRFRSEA